MSAQVHDLVAVCKEILGPRQPRIGRQLELEAAIVAFNADLIEASELLDSISAALHNRYAADRLLVVDEEMRALKVALAEAQPYEPSKEDEAYAEWRARRECD
jgi:hypothetical protein